MKIVKRSPAGMPLFWFAHSRLRSALKGEETERPQTNPREFTNSLYLHDNTGLQLSQRGLRSLSFDGFTELFEFCFRESYDIAERFGGIRQ